MPINLPLLSNLSDDLIFRVCSFSTLPAWLCMAILPRLGKDKLRAVVYPAILFNCVVYTLTFLSSFAESKSGVLEAYGKMSTLEGTKSLFSNGDIVLPAWVHYIAFDLTVAMYLTEKNNSNADPLPQLVMAPVLFFCLMAGPIGALIYFIVRAFYTFVLHKEKPAEKQS